MNRPPQMEVERASVESLDLDVARYYYDQRVQIHQDAAMLRALMGAVNWVNDLTPAAVGAVVQRRPGIQPGSDPGARTGLRELDGGVLSGGVTPGTHAGGQPVQQRSVERRDRPALEADRAARVVRLSRRAGDRHPRCRLRQLLLRDSKRVLLPLGRARVRDRGDGARNRILPLHRRPPNIWSSCTTSPTTATRRPAIVRRPADLEGFAHAAGKAGASGARQHRLDELVAGSGGGDRRLRAQK